jgi:hypothetical protein
MITLITGLPRAGKTVFALAHIKYEVGDNPYGTYYYVPRENMAQNFPAHWKSVKLDVVHSLRDLTTLFLEVIPAPHKLELHQLFERWKTDGIKVYLTVESVDSISKTARDLVDVFIHVKRIDENTAEITKTFRWNYEYPESRTIPPDIST